MSAPTLFTIGYEGAAIGPALDRLSGAGVGLLIDVRALPLSRKPGFSRRQLAAGVEERGIRYAHLRGLGTPKPGRDAARRGDTETMTAIFAAHMLTDAARHDLEAAIGLAGQTPACLLCFEREPHRCHRRIVAELIAERSGQRIEHLLVYG